MIIVGREKRVQTKLRPISDFFMIMFLFRSAPLVLSLSISRYGYCYDCCDCLLRGHHHWCGCCCCLRIHLVVDFFRVLGSFLFLLLLFFATSIIQSRRSLRLVNTIIALPRSFAHSLARSYASLNGSMLQIKMKWEVQKKDRDERKNETKMIEKWI